MDNYYTETSTVEELKATIDKLAANQSEQNSYITQVEKERNQYKADADKYKEQLGQAQAQPAQAQPTHAPYINENYEAYAKKKWREDVINTSLNRLTTYNKQHVEILRQEVIDYCQENMTDETTNEKYVLAVFNMLYGQAIGNPKHAIHVQQAPPKTEDPVPPAQETQPKPPATPAPPTVQQFQQQFPPSVGRPGDQVQNPATVQDPGQPPKMRNTQDAFDHLEAALKGQ